MITGNSAEFVVFDDYAHDGSVLASELISEVVDEQHEQARKALKELAREVAKRRDLAEAAERNLEEAAEAYEGRSYDVGYSPSHDGNAITFRFASGLTLQVPLRGRV